MLTYGLTGGMGCGKSTVAGMFREKGVPSFDADQLAKRLLEEDEEISLRVAQRFPDCAESIDGARSIDRRKLAERIFSDSEDRRALEGLLHPAVWKAYQAQAAKLPRPRPAACLLEGAVFLESQTRFPVAGFIVVVASTDTRLRRLRQGGAWDDQQVRARMAAQFPQHHKLVRAHYLIDNGGNTQRTQRQVDATFFALLRECGGRA